MQVLSRRRLFPYYLNCKYPFFLSLFPDADENGYVAMPNVDLIKETTDSMAATHSYNANITAFNAIKLMAQKALEIGQ